MDRLDASPRTIVVTAGPPSQSASVPPAASGREVTKSQDPSTSTWSTLSPRPFMARRAARRWASAMPNSVHSVTVAWPTETARAQATMRSCSDSRSEALSILESRTL